MIYIISRGNRVTGGPETLHQAANMIASMGYNVRMYYAEPHTMNVPRQYKVYNIQATDTIEDSEENCLIIPETLTHLLRKFKKIRVCIWWLSLEFYLKADPVTLIKWRMEANKWPRVLFPIAFLVLAAKGKIHFHQYHFDDNGKYLHAYNCEYARLYLANKGIPEEKCVYLCGPLNHTFFEKTIDKKNVRENVILYNPKKGIEFTQKLIAAAKKSSLDAEFIALQGMTPDQISDLMTRAKIYMDFGEFPGPERIPREAVTMGCNIITGRRGSAANDIDIPIPNEMKFEDKEENIPDILEKINDMLNNYDKYYPYYDKYRIKVKNQVSLLRENARILMDKFYSNDN